MNYIACGLLVVSGVFGFLYREKIAFVYEFLCLKTKLKILEMLDVGIANHTKDNKYEVNYMLGATKYKFVFEKKRGPSNYSKITDEEGDDITAEIKRCAGPGHNFHGIPSTPALLGKKGMSFHMKTGRVRKCNENDFLIEY